MNSYHFFFHRLSCIAHNIFIPSFFLPVFSLVLDSYRQQLNIIIRYHSLKITKAPHSFNSFTIIVNCRLWCWLCHLMCVDIILQSLNKVTGNRILYVLMGQYNIALIIVHHTKHNYYKTSMMIQRLKKFCTQYSPTLI